tara:strand:+ start:853 stop:1677 length:825 start_codon:yes stop_codon:yes gene_type:complete
MEDKIGIMGNGFVGNALYKGITTFNKNVFVYDVDIKRSINTLQDIAKCNIIFLCVPTPKHTVTGEVDMSYTYQAIESLIDCGINDNVILVIKSTVKPGTCKNLQEKYNIPVLSNPEFLTERYALEDFMDPRCIIIGGDVKPRNTLKRFYENGFPSTNEHGKIHKYFLTDSITSELIKYTTNCFFSVKIAFMNEMKQICDQAEGNWEELVEGFIKEGRVFPEHLDVPGHDGKLGFGGRCFPKDLSAMVEYSKQNNIDPKIMQAATDKNKELRSDT